MTKLLAFETLERPDTPNTFLVLPAGMASTAHPDEISPVYDEPAEALYQRLKMLAVGKDRWTIAAHGDNEMQLEIVAATKLLKFKDDLSIRVVSAKDRAQTAEIAVYSRSRLGKYDFKANQKRVQTLLSELKGNAAATA
ncbi:DUF1499 domain-containing protein [Henriciella marina]|uniref:DUF1499 domain-containing protein n=1 Tax=Henriciella marina TaxID=453851 RepID=A0ABT4LVF3_9PROT|nr:DUF1499 domain-containing protein [Henriciella marina]MCZ4298327.1 DUF1499 domain-containing protein [Henriciella marina]